MLLNNKKKYLAKYIANYQLNYSPKSFNFGIGYLLSTISLIITLHFSSIRNAYS